MESLKQKFYEKYALVQTTKIRDFISEFDWSNRLIGIKGSRGVGKTTLILQYIKLNYKADNTVLYVSLDNLYFSNNSIYNLADSFSKQGGKLLTIDEVHRYSNWAIEIKNIYDDFPDLKVIFTGSSLLHISKSKADLSRRAVLYNLPGLSFREFIWFQTDIRFNKTSIKDIIENHVELAINVKQKIKPIEYFINYLNYGYYPYYLENTKSYHQKLSETILTILEVDIPQFANIQTSNITLLKKLLEIISKSVPFKPNIKSLSERTGISINTLKLYLKLLNDSDLLQLLYRESKGINSLGKPDKIYLNNSNLMRNLAGDNLNIGNVRETFFLNQVSINYNVNESKISDFIIDEKYTFEIGGKNKTMKQINNISNAYLAKDNIEIGADSSIPLWLFGFLY